MSDRVYLFATWRVRPTYHAYGRIRGLDLERADVTRCGLVMWDGAVRYDATLRRDHADLFAQPCSKCFGAGGDR